jgi:hypothetical protein
VEQFMMFIGCGDEYQQKKKVAFWYWLAFFIHFLSFLTY